jgi:hypothetical protein
MPTQGSQFLPLISMLILFAASVSAATFVVPDDAELVDKAGAIVIGTVEGSSVQQIAGLIETVYEVRVSRSMKGGILPDELLRLYSPGGLIEGTGGLFVSGSAHFEFGDQVLLFLTQVEGRWRTVDLTLGKFTFVISTSGERLLVRDVENVVGWDRSGRVHNEKVRREQPFLRFVEERVSRPHRPNSAEDYFIAASEVTLRPHTDEVQQGSLSTSFPPRTYTDNVSDGTTHRGIRWSNIGSGVPFRKRADQHASGLPDGGVGVIQNALAAWASPCASTIHLVYAGTTPTASAHHDGINVVEFNDPQNRIPGSWTGSGTIGLAFMSFAGTHTFAGDTWWTITDADVVFQNGYPGTHVTFPTAMTHEIGHGIGWRHSNEHHIGRGACNSAVEECSNRAIMFSTMIAELGHTLQPWDINAARAVYPGGSCGGVRGDFNNDGYVDLVWRHPSSGENAIWLMQGTTYLSGLRIQSVTDANWRIAGAADFNGDGYMDLLWRHRGDGRNAIWFMQGGTYLGGAQLSTVADLNWDIGGVSDFNGDGRPDLLWRNRSTGRNTIWFMNGTVMTGSADILSVTDSNWRIEGTGDFNGDGHADIIWRNYATGQNAMWFMNRATYVAGAHVNAVTDLN